MRNAPLSVLLAPALLVPALLLARPAQAETPAPAALAAPPAPRSTAVAVTLEVVSPLGAVGCFYRRRYLPGALVTASALITGGSLIYALATNNRDASILNAVAYGVTRLIGIAAASRPDSPHLAAPAPAPTPNPAPRAATPALSARTIGLSYVLAF